MSRLSFIAVAAALAVAAGAVAAPIEVITDGDSPDRLLRFDGTGGDMPAPGRSGADYTVDPGGNFYPNSIKIGPNGNVFTTNANYGANRVDEFDRASGNLVNSYVLDTSAGQPLEGEKYTWGMEFLPTGEMLTTHRSTDKVVKTDLGTGVSTDFITAGLTDPAKLIWSQDGSTLYLAQGSVLDKYSPAGAYLASVSGIGGKDARGLAWGSDGCLYVAGRYSDLKKYDPSSGIVSTVATRSQIGGGPNENEMHGIGFLPNGELLLIRGTTAEIIRVDVSDGSVLGQFVDLSGYGFYNGYNDLLVIPEPATLALLTLGGVVALVRRRRR